MSVLHSFTEIESGLNHIEIERINGIKHGMFNNKSYWDCKSSVLKSGVCKYFRRELFDKFEWCVMEMMIFGLKSEALLTNIVNRMKILIFEEILVNEIEVINKCVYLFDMMDNINSFVGKIEIMKEICRLVKTCKKCRMVSYVNNWWRFNGRHYMNIVLNKLTFSTSNQQKYIVNNCQYTQNNC